MVDRPATTSTLCTVASGQSFLTSLIPTAVGNATKVFDVDSALTDTSISGAYIDEIWFTYTKDVNRVIDAASASSATYTRAAAVLTVTLTAHNFKVGQKLFFDVQSGGVPIDFCIYLVSTGTITNINQFFPLIVQSIPSVPENQTLSTTLTEKLPLINHPTVQSGALNFAGSNNEIAPKQRGLMLRRGQALYVAASGATALTNGFFCNIQGGFY
jgi:hypothetical protein